MTGRVIAGRYNLQHPIGRGAMGVVWRARDQILDRDVAVKEVVISSLIGEEERRNAYQRTLREARTAARLSHRGLVAVYDVAEEDGRPWIVMELVPSRSLDQVLTVEGRLPALRVARIGQQLLSALAAAHIAGVLHRDVKPSNVLIASDRTGTGWDERAVLTDFGIAQFEGDPRLTQTGMVMGSPGFTAPERIRGGDAAPASDLWSLGATLYAAVEGRGPYEQRGGAITTMSAIINEDAPVPAHAGRLAPVITALLRRDPSARPAAPAAARMFAYVLPLLSAAEPEHPAPAHPPTAASQARPSAGADAPRPKSPASAEPAAARELLAAAAPAAIEAPAPAVAATTPEDRAPAMARVAKRAAEAEATSPAVPKEPAPADAPAPASVPESGAEAEPSAEAKVPEANAPEPLDEAAEADAEVNAEAADDVTAATPAAGPEADAEAEADAAVAADSAAGGDLADPADEDVSAVEAASAVEASQQPDGGEDAGAAVTAGVAVNAAEPVASGPTQSGSGDTVIDGRSADFRQQPKPKPAPTFTAAKPGERAAAPTFSAAQPGTAKRTPQAAHGSAQSSVAQSGPPSYWPAPQGAAAQGAQRPAAAQSEGAGPQYGQHSAAAGSTAGAAPQYAGPSQPYADLAAQYPPAPAGGSGQRRTGSRRWIVLLICAVLVAAAIGAGAALALHHNNGSGSTGTGTTTVIKGDPQTRFQSVNALNNPSATVPAGWVSETVTPSQYNTTAGFTVDVPPGWKEEPKGLSIYFYGPNDMVLDIDLTPHTYPGNMVKEAEYLEQKQAQLGDTFAGYARAALQGVPVRGTHGAIWQFTWIDKGVKVRADDILFVLPTSAGKQSYAVYIRAPNSGWGSKYLPIFDESLPTFEPVTTS
jgi:eukaryotic-like serine/threonine-protein kinase